MNRAENVVNFYVLTNKLKNIIRTGWKHWGVKATRLESVAEHIYGVQMLAIAIYSEYKYDLDISKVLYMLAIHELEEISIGDLTQFEISKEEKRKLGAEAVEKILNNLLNKTDILHLINEFEDKSSSEAMFAYFCDKLECDLQCKLYDEDNCVNLNEQQNNLIMNDSLVKELLSKKYNWSKMWLKFSQMNYGYDSNFMEVSNYALEHDIS